MRRLLFPLVLALVVGGAGGVFRADTVTASAPGTALNRVLLDQHGRPLAGEPVQLTWDGHASAGETRVLAKTVADEDGGVALDWTPTKADLRAARPNGGWFNFTLLVGDPDHAGVLSFPAKWDGSTWLMDNPETPGTPAARRINDRPLRVHMSDMALPSAEFARKTEAAARAATKFEEWTLIANVPSGKDTKTTFTYGRKGDSTIEVKKSLDYEKWTSSGSSKVSNTEGAAVHGKVSGARTRQLSVSMEYDRELVCVAGWTCYTYIRGREWTGDAKAPKITNWPCQHGKEYSVYKKPEFTGVSRESGENRTYDTGAEVAGVGLWARSGYSSNASIQVTFNAKKKVKHNRYCVGGSTGRWTTAKTLYVSSWRA